MKQFIDIVTNFKASLNKGYLFTSLVFYLGFAVLIFELMKNIWI